MSKRIELTQGQFAIVDDADYEWASKVKWCAQRARNTFYAVRTVGVRPFRTVKRLHREIMNAPDGVQVDHRDGNGLNCVRSNLRIATNAQNLRNRGAQSNNTSRYKGVHWQKQAGKWQARIGVNGKRIHLGLFDDPIEAAHAYDTAARKHHGRFARTNF